MGPRRLIGIVLLLSTLSAQLSTARCQTRIKDLPSSTSVTANTKIPLDDATYGVRSITWPNLVSAIQTNSATYILGTNGFVASLNGSATNLILSGQSSVPADSMLELQYSMTGAAPEAAARKDYVDNISIAIVDDLAELLAIPSPPNQRLAIVLGDTITGDTSDGATGEWMFFPSSTATASPVVKIPNDRSPVTLGRWIKRL